MKWNKNIIPYKEFYAYLKIIMECIINPFHGKSKKNHKHHCLCLYGDGMTSCNDTHHMKTLLKIWTIYVFSSAFLLFTPPFSVNGFLLLYFPHLLKRYEYLSLAWKYLKVPEE